MTTILYQNRGLRAIRDCLTMPTSFTTELGHRKHESLPGFVLSGELFGRTRVFYIIDDQLFVVKLQGQFHLGTVAKSSLRQLYATRRPNTISKGDNQE